MATRNFKIFRGFIAGFLLLVCGIYIGSRFCEHDRNQLISSLIAEGKATTLMSDAAELQNLKLGRASCARWFLESRIKGVTSNMEVYRRNAGVSPGSLQRLEQAAEMGRVALTSTDNSGIDMKKDCS